MRENKRQAAERITRANELWPDSEPNPEFQIVRDEEGRCREIQLEGLRIKL